ncbi:MAG: RagB/SusD family nutrient uptake outer membrane protein [Bacteroidales bacterium]|nr:RagB/SusD family nutrient uptake outer membrane protein [Bacteroidales bacterium]
MKKIIPLLYIAALSIFSSCSKDFLDRGSQIIFDDTNFWTSENNVKSYCWEFYNRFRGFGTGTTGDFYFTTFNDDQAASGMDIFPTAAPASDNNWEYTYIRKANLLLIRAPKVPMSTEAVNHYLGVARFFRAYEYANMVRHFGDVPYINEYLDQGQTEMIYTPRTPRKAVVDSIMSDLLFAARNIRSVERSKALGDVNVLSKEAVWAYLSRVALYEGTYSKYVAKDAAQAERLLRIAKDAASNFVANALLPYKLSPMYKDVYSSLDLSKNNEVILYKSYISGIMTHSVVGYTNSSTMMAGLTKDAVDSYLCSDGLPVTLSPLYKGDDNIENTLANRDLRLAQSVENTLAYIGTPNEKGFTSSTGYKISKFDNADLTASEILAPNNPTDAPIFWLAEVYLNYAEAAAELGELTQTDLDNTINLLRIRAGVAALSLASIPDDPMRDADVSPLLWEIRRERRCELMMDGFRSWDIRRWGKLEYLNPLLKPAIFMGAKVPVPQDDNGPATDAAGYILPYGTNAKREVEIPKNYLDPIPTGQQTLYILKGVEFPQNPGW